MNTLLWYGFTSDTFRGIALSVLLSILAGGLLGYERERHGRAAGFRTTILVSLASCLLMILSKYGFDDMAGRDSAFWSVDVSRVAAGCVSGMGFLGAGAIVRQSDSVVKGVTTAATLWCATAIGLILGTGMIGLGVAATLLAYGVLTLFSRVERKILDDRYASLVVEFDAGTTNAEALLEAIGSFSVSVIQVDYAADGVSAPAHRKAAFSIRYKSRRISHVGRLSVPLIEALSAIPGVSRASWQG